MNRSQMTCGCHVREGGANVPEGAGVVGGVACELPAAGSFLLRAAPQARCQLLLVAVGCCRLLVDLRVVSWSQPGTPEVVPGSVLAEPNRAERDSSGPVTRVPAAGESRAT